MPSAPFHDSPCAPGHCMSKHSNTSSNISKDLPSMASPTPEMGVLSWDLIPMLFIITSMDSQIPTMPWIQIPTAPSLGPFSCWLEALFHGVPSYNQPYLNPPLRLNMSHQLKLPRKLYCSVAS